MKCLSRDSDERGDSLSLALQSDHAQKTQLRSSSNLTRHTENRSHKIVQSDQGFRLSRMEVNQHSTTICLRVTFKDTVQRTNSRFLTPLSERLSQILSEPSQFLTNQTNRSPRLWTEPSISRDADEGTTDLCRQSHIPATNGGGWSGRRETKTVELGSACV